MEPWVVVDDSAILEDELDLLLVACLPPDPGIAHLSLDQELLHPLHLLLSLLQTWVGPFELGKYQMAYHRATEAYS